jgi:hypothetical protein
MVAVAVARLDIVVVGGGVEIVLCSFGHDSDPRARRKEICLMLWIVALCKESREKRKGDPKNQKGKIENPDRR